MALRIKAIGFRVHVKPDPVEEVTKGGIVLPKNKRREQVEMSKGTVMEIGPLAWKNQLYGFGTEGWEPWCKVGDRVFYSKYAGKLLVDQEDENNAIIVLNDDDVHCVILEDSEKGEEVVDDGHIE
jgi:co-chaperonin GroES (HSP10)